MYHYLTGAASWYMLTVITEVFGVRGELGDLILEPKLMECQFDQEGKASIGLTFAGKQIQVNYYNPKHCKVEDYGIDQVTVDGQIQQNMDHKEKENKQTDQEQKTGKFRISRAFFNSSRKQSHTIEVELA